MRKLPKKTEVIILEKVGDSVGANNFISASCNENNSYNQLYQMVYDSAPYLTEDTIKSLMKNDKYVSNLQRLNRMNNI